MNIPDLGPNRLRPEDSAARNPNRGRTRNKSSDERDTLNTMQRRKKACKKARSPRSHLATV